MTTTEMLNDGRTTRTVIAQMLASRYVQQIEAREHRFAPVGTFERVRGIADEVVYALAEGCEIDKLLAVNGDVGEVGDVIRFARDGGLAAAHKRALEGAA
jgi:hypothetical protein